MQQSTARPTGRRLRTVAEDLGLAYITVWRAIRAGSLQAGRAGRSYVISDEAVRAWLAAGTAPKPEAQA
jgi:excisionase family DNA binding protein